MWTNQLNQTASTIDICISRSSVVVHRTQDLNLHFEFIVVIHLIYIRYKGDDANCGGWLVGGARVKENLRTMRLCNTIYTISKMTLVHDVFKYIIYREADFWALFGHSIANICVILCVGCLALVNSCEMYHLYTRKAMDICNTVKCYTSEHLYSFFSPTAMVVLLTICCSFNYVFYVHYVTSHMFEHHVFLFMSFEFTYSSMHSDRKRAELGTYSVLHQMVWQQSNSAHQICSLLYSIYLHYSPRVNRIYARTRDIAHCTCKEMDALVPPQGIKSVSAITRR